MNTKGVVAEGSAQHFESNEMPDDMNDVAGAGAGGRADAIGSAAVGGMVSAHFGGLSPMNSLGVGIGAGIAAAGSGASSGRVICTHFYQKGMLDRDVWRADMAFTAKNLSAVTVRGYQCWAIPYVRLMRRSRLAERVIYPLAVWRAEELAFRMGVLPRSNWRGKLVRALGEPLCYAIGLFAAEQNWESLWTEKFEAASPAAE